jgi:hypothetical protein
MIVYLYVDDSWEDFGKKISEFCMKEDTFDKLVFRIEWSRFRQATERFKSKSNELAFHLKMSGKT